MLETQICLVFLYFLLGKLTKTGKQKSLGEEGYEK